MPEDASQATGYARATDNLRTAARWLLTAAAASGAVMVAGVQLTSIGSLGPADWPRLIAAAGGLAAGLGAVGYMIYHASLLLTDAWITLAQLVLEPFSQQLRDSRRRRDRRRAGEIERIRTEIESYQDEFYGSVADSMSDLYHRLIEANKKARESPSPEHSQTAASLKRTVDTLVEAANYSYARAEFAVLRRRLTEAGAVFIAGIVIFAYAANPPKPAAQAPSSGRAAVQESPGRVPTSPASSRAPGK
jgi:hypothetical protein